jgi:hypothetical protein
MLDLALGVAALLLMLFAAAGCGYVVGVRHERRQGRKA